MGRRRDQAALHGLLARLEAVGAQVVEVHRLHEPGPPPIGPPPGESRAVDAR
jgi:hypothetical protein